MRQIRKYSDSRWDSGCSFCGERETTRDHVPSKVFLEPPYPANLAVVPACFKCNQASSMAEAYVACLLGIICTGGIPKGTAAKTLEKHPVIKKEIEAARRPGFWGDSYQIDIDRLFLVLQKFAQGHARYELSELFLNEPQSFWAKPLTQMSGSEVSEFETLKKAQIYPEIGSRAFQRMVVTQSLGAEALSGSNVEWIVVQPSRYRYLVSASADVIVRLVIREYLACEVRW